jgi:hypothetical protein
VAALVGVAVGPHDMPHQIHATRGSEPTTRSAAFPRHLPHPSPEGVAQFGRGPRIGCLTCLARHRRLPCSPRLRVWPITFGDLVAGPHWLAAPLARSSA